MIGFVIGVISGGVQFWLLSKFTKLISAGKLSGAAIALGFLQFFMPMVILLGVAFTIRQELLWAGVGIVASLLICAVIKFVFNTRKRRGGGDADV